MLPALLPHPLEFSRIAAGTFLFQRERKDWYWCKENSTFYFSLLGFQCLKASYLDEENAG
jgi:hypothetical protein